MSNLVFKLWIDSGASAIICWATRRHHCLPSSYRDQSCTRCPHIEPRTDRR